jgi:acyl-CoA reductase-like NAD-dependent aldehyde dehydrogenase
MKSADYDLFIGGARARAQSVERLERRNPSTQSLVATYPRASAAEVAQAVAAARRALDSPGWRDLTPADRSALLERCALAVERASERLAEIIEAEVGKPAPLALAEVREGCALWRYAPASLRSLRGECYPALSPDTQGYTFYDPVGVVGLILPWNFLSSSAPSACRSSSPPAAPWW